jgi:hypothetical protein
MQRRHVRLARARRVCLCVVAQVGRAVLGHSEAFRQPWELAPCCDQTHIRIVLADKAPVDGHVVSRCLFVMLMWSLCDGHCCPKV